MVARKSPDWVAFSLKASVLYCVVSIATLPFLDAIWLSEIPVLALVQVPKLLIAGWLRTGVVMAAIRAMGLSSGSFSPDYVLAGPYALGITYLIALLGVLGNAWHRTRLVHPYRAWACVLVVVAVLDFYLTLEYSSRPGLTVY